MCHTFLNTLPEGIRSKLVPFAGNHENSSLSVQAVLPNGEWLLLGFQATDNVVNGHPEIIQLDATGDLQWKQLPSLECFFGSPCARIVSLVPIGDFIWRMEVTTDGHPRIVRCTTTGEPLDNVDLGPYATINGLLQDAVPGNAPDQVLIVGSIIVWLHCQRTTSYMDTDATTRTTVVAPNPAQQSFSVQLPSTGEYRLLLPDSVGRHWKNQVFAGESAIVDCTALPAGLYFLSVAGESGKVYRNVVTVTH